MRQTTLKTLLHHRRAKVDTGLFSTPTIRRVLRSKSQSEGRAISTALSHTRCAHCTATPNTTGEASHSIGHTSYLQACASRGTALRQRDEHGSTSKGELLKQAGETLRARGAPAPQRLCQRLTQRRLLRRRGEGPGAGSVPQEQPAGLSPPSQLPAAGRGAAGAVQGQPCPGRLAPAKGCSSVTCRGLLQCHLLGSGW